MYSQSIDYGSETIWHAGGSTLNTIMLVLDLFTWKYAGEKGIYLKARGILIMSRFENIVKNEAFAHNEQILHFSQCFQIE